MKLYTLNGQQITPGSAFSSSVSGAEVLHPANWAEAWGPEDFARFGVTVEDAPAPEPSPPEPPAIISDRQFFQQLAVMGQITEDEALAAVMTGAIPAALEAFIGTLPPEQQFPARMLLSGATTFDRFHPMTALLAQGMGWTQQQIEQLWAAASLL